jgi:hypothetical protein
MRGFTTRLRHECGNCEQRDGDRGVERDQAYEPGATHVQEAGGRPVIAPVIGYADVGAIGIDVARHLAIDVSHDELAIERTTSAIAMVPTENPANASVSKTT